MLCPKCSREISSEKNSCDFCGFTFQTPKTEANPAPAYGAPTFQIPTYEAPKTTAYQAPAYEAPAAAVPPVQAAASANEPASRSAYTAPYAQNAFYTPNFTPAYAPQAPAYAAPTYPRTAPLTESAEPLTVGQYIGMMLLGLVPLVGLIFYIIWACRKKSNPNRRRFAAAALILKAVGFMFLLGAGFIILSYYTPLFFYVFR